MFDSQTHAATLRSISPRGKAREPLVSRALPHVVTRAVPAQSVGQTSRLPVPGTSGSEDIARVDAFPLGRLGRGRARGPRGESVGENGSPRWLIRPAKPRPPARSPMVQPSGWAGRGKDRGSGRDCGSSFAPSGLGKVPEDGRFQGVVPFADEWPPPWGGGSPHHGAFHAFPAPNGAPIRQRRATPWKRPPPHPDEP